MHRTAADLDKAIECFTQATQADGKYALAYSGLADCYLILPHYARRSPKECFPKAVAAAKQALELDEGLAEAHTSLAFGKFVWEWDWPGADKEFQRANRIEPRLCAATRGLLIFKAGLA